MLSYRIRSFIYQLIYNAGMRKIDFKRSPTLETVLMIEKTVKKHSGEHRRDIWKRLPKKVMWQTYIFTLDYLRSINKIAFDRLNHVGYIWDPALVKKYAKRPDLDVKNAIKSDIRRRKDKK